MCDFMFKNSTTISIFTLGYERVKRGREECELGAGHVNGPETLVR